MKEKGKKETAKVIYFIVFVNCDGIVYFIPYKFIVRKSRNGEEYAYDSIYSENDI